MSSRLVNTVLGFCRAAEEHPAMAASRDVIADLRKECDRALDGAFVAQFSPVAPDRGMARNTLIKTVQESEETICEFGQEVELVGIIPTVLLIDSTQSIVEPPPAAIDVQIAVRRGDNLTYRVEQKTANVTIPDRFVVNLPHIDIAAPALWGTHLLDQNPVLSFKCRWAVPLAVVTAMKWGDVQISFGLCIRPLGDNRGR